MGWGCKQRKKKDKQKHKTKSEKMKGDNATIFCIIYFLSYCHICECTALLTLSTISHRVSSYPALHVVLCTETFSLLVFVNFIQGVKYSNDICVTFKRALRNLLWSCHYSATICTMGGTGSPSRNLPVTGVFVVWNGQEYSKRTSLVVAQVGQHVLHSCD